MDKDFREITEDEGLDRSIRIDSTRVKWARYRRLSPRPFGTRLAQDPQNKDKNTYKHTDQTRSPTPEDHARNKSLLFLSYRWGMLHQHHPTKVEGKTREENQATRRAARTPNPFIPSSVCSQRAHPTFPVTDHFMRMSSSVSNPLATCCWIWETR